MDEQRFRTAMPGADCRDGGFTLIELVVVMLIGGVVMSLGAFSFSSWQNQVEQKGTASVVVSEFRRAATLAVSEGRTHCVQLRTTQRDLQLWRYRCAASGTAVSGAKRAQGSHETVNSAPPAATASTPCPAGAKCFYFYPRGTATPGTVTVASTKRSKVYTVRVEGLTSRVHM